MEDFGFWLSRTFASTRAKQPEWPYVPGTYVVINPRAPVAVTTLGSVALASEVAREPPAGLCIVGKVETENIGIEKIIKNVLSNSDIRFFVCAGAEPPKHLTGATMLALFRDGVDERMKIIGSPGMRPVLPNTTPAEVEVFRRQVEPVDMVGCTDVAAIHAKVVELASRARPARAAGFVPRPDMGTAAAVERVRAEGTDPQRIKLDVQGYFVINIEGDTLLVEHYSYKEKLLRVIEGQDARSIYLTIVRNGWVSKLDHASYLGKELARAEQCLRDGTTFVQDGG
jgi:tetrahydromethanopterin S-methyltransferase subunit A